MKILKPVLILFIMLTLLCQNALAFNEKVEGLEYVVRKLENPPMERAIVSRYDLYELYLENRSDKVFSVPGYSVDLGVNYSSLPEIRSSFKSKKSNKLAIFTIATSAASFALGGIAKTAASTLRTVNLYRKNNQSLNEDDNVLNKNKTYIIYPGDGLSLFLFVDRFLGQSPSTVRFICKDEESGLSNVVINNHIELRELNVQNIDESNRNNDEKNNVIAAPATDMYK